MTGAFTLRRNGHYSFDLEPLPPDEDQSFPKGCLVGCESRKAIAASRSKADLCN